jgi:hypothetical protein
MASEKKVLPGNMVSELDQASAGIEVMAGLITAYYKALVDSGMPKALAMLITKEFAMISAQRIMSGNANPTQGDANERP